MKNYTVSDLNLRGNCVTPFLDASKFGPGGYIEGRFCAPVYELPGIPTCCLPCPATNWAYSDSFATYGLVAAWLNVVGLVLMVFMLITYWVLPTQQTRSHYLSVCLVLSICLIALGFTIPLADDPQQCFNEITPNDMYSSLECAWSGALIIAGGLCAVTWILVRALSMNLQIVWDIVPGKKFFYISQVLGWGVPGALFTAVITVTGVSFRFGSACHVNHANSMADFWGPLLALAGMAGVLQLVTFGYCLHVYLRNLWTDDSTTTERSGSELPSQKSVRRPRAVYRRLKKVLWLQWRGICIVTIILVDVVFFSIVFVYMDGMQNNIVTDASKWVKVKPWLVCLVAADGDKEKCLDLVQGWLISQPTVTAVLFMLSLAGVQVFLLLMRPNVFPAWWDLIRSKFSSSRQEFVSCDAKSEVMRSNSTSGLLSGRHKGASPMAFEMHSKSRVVTSETELKDIGSTVSSPDEAYKSPLQGYRDSPSTDDPYDINDPFSPEIERGRLPPEYARSAITPSPAFDTGLAYARQVVESYTQNRPPVASGRRHPPPHSNFSPLAPPSREGSFKSVSFDAREHRGGLALNPPRDAREVRDDVTSPHRTYSNHWKR